MRFRRSVLIAALVSVLIDPSLFAQTLTVRVSRGNVRAQPSKSSPITGKINKGEVYDTEGHQGDWFKILLETGREGWVFKSLVEVSGKRTIGVVPSGPTPSASRPYGDSWAIVVGINRYRKPAKSLRLYIDRAIYMLKPASYRYFSPVAGQSDGNRIIADLMRPSVSESSAVHS